MATPNIHEQARYRFQTSCNSPAKSLDHDLSHTSRVQRRELAWSCFYLPGFLQNVSELQFSAGESHP